MSKKITSLEDLAKVSGTAFAELGLRNKIKSSENQEEKSTPIIKIETKSPIKKNKPVISNKKTKLIIIPSMENIKDPEKYLAERMKEPNPIHGYIREMKKDEVEKNIKDQGKRVIAIRQIYDRRVKNGDQAIGYISAVASIYREIDQMTRFLNEQIKDVD